jgi:6-pyruvoyl-tetrahydropterin synthase
MPIKEKKGFSIYLNVLFFNFIMVFLYNLVVSIKTECSNKLSKKDLEKHSDFIVDLNNTSKRILRMINPNIKNRLSNKGLSIILNTLVGFDSEFVHHSTGDSTNKLLSIQLAGSTGLVLKVPLNKPYSSKDFRIAALAYKNENKISSVLHKSINILINDIRSKLYAENDVLLEKFHDKLSELDFNGSCVIGDYEVFTLKNSDVKQLIKYPEEYKSTELINDCESLNEGEHEKSLSYIIGLLNEVSGNEMSAKLSNSIKTNSTKPLSRITYRHSKSRLSITLNRVTYICAHESAADLSMLSDFDKFKENLDIVHRSFVTLTKPILIKDCKSKIHFRDTILLSPMGAKSLKAVGDIYGGEFRKIELSPEYIKRMDLLLVENPELFERYAKQDAFVTLKHASTMEDFNLTVSKIGVPLTLSSVGKSYVLKE